MKRGKSELKELVLCGLFCALITVGAYIKIPVGPVPVTLQLSFATLSGLLLGKKYGAISALLYLFIGFIGLPVFTGGGGFAYVLRPTFGYIIGFSAAAFIAGALRGKEPFSFLRIFAASIAGICADYLIGAAYLQAISRFYLDKPLPLSTLLISCVLIFIPANFVLAAVFSFAAKRLLKMRLL